MVSNINEIKYFIITRMVFNKSACIIRKAYCGNGAVPKDTKTKKYSRKGTAYECLRKGYGIADWEHRKKSLAANSLQQIMYIGPVLEGNFIKKGIRTTTSLISRARKLSVAAKKSLLTACCKRSNGSVDQRAVNSVLLYLYDHKVGNLPECKIFKE
jgi:hypothetical protein